jgi:holliday junction DNA helicase RuvB
MAERIISEALTVPRYVTCPCQYCSGKIEFDANQLDAAENTTVPCPHCGLETIIFVPKQQGVPPIISPAEPPKGFVQPATGLDLETVVRNNEIQRQADLGAAFFQQGNYNEAVKYFAETAKQGHPDAQCNLGICYANGHGVVEDHSEGVKWWLKAAEQGHALAAFCLGSAYQHGAGVTKNESEAIKWFHKAATQGIAMAQDRLSGFYEKAQDYVEAYKWAKLAAVQGYKGAQKKREELALKMNAAQIEALEPADRIIWRNERLTPKQFSDFVGQERTNARLEIAVAAAKQRREALDHVLLIGPPGAGKAILVHILARAMGANLKSTTGPTIEKAGDLAGLLTNLEEGDVLFIDEIHRLQRTIEEYLCPAMKDFKLDIVVDQGPDARSVRLNLPRFTLIGTTPRKERLIPALLSCFPIIEKMDAYSVEELAALACRFAKSLEVEIDAKTAERIAHSTDGTPLDVLNRLRHIRDYAHIKANGSITAEVAGQALKMLLPAEETSEANDGRAAIPSEVRREVWRRDGGKCVKCGSRERLEYDHIIPVTRGGSNTARNIELLCETCNRAKSDLIR